ncbi:MAG: FixH family protein [Cytophagaceae bacterium]|nr:FixH family protein [Cytophagaceae bacterium]
MKINWGYSVAFAFIGFAAFIIYMVMQAYKQDINLVSEDYYAKEIKYQEQMDKMNNAYDIKDQIVITQNEKRVTIGFPISKAEGTVNFLRPSDEKKDLKKNIKLNNNNEQHFNKEEFHRGLYKVQLDWEHDNKKYFVEKNLFVQ